MLDKTAHHLSAQAKINLSLRIVGRRSDGYHILNMVNVLTSLSDDIEIQICEEPDITITCESSEADIPAADNVIYKAIKLFFELCHLPYGAKVALRKNIPIGGGLGGGSADAAAVLRFLETTFKSECLGLDVAALAARIGADVPYLLYGGLALVGGIGEEITPLEADSLPEAVLLIPEDRISTPQAFKYYRERHPQIEADLLKEEECLKAFDFPIYNGKRDYSKLLALCENDLTEPAKALSPQVCQTLDKLAGSEDFQVCLTGSGSAMFALPRYEGGGWKDALQRRIKSENIKFLRLIPIKLLAKKNE